MNENLIPPSVLDLVKKYNAATDINEKVALENRLKDISVFVQEALDSNKRKMSAAFTRRF